MCEIGKLSKPEEKRFSLTLWSLRQQDHPLGTMKYVLLIGMELFVLWPILFFQLCITGSSKSQVNNYSWRKSKACRCILSLIGTGAEVLGLWGGSYISIAYEHSLFPVVFYVQQRNVAHLLAKWSQLSKAALPVHLLLGNQVTQPRFMEAFSSQGIC